MSVDLWDGQRPVLADTSAWMVARRDPAARELLQGVLAAMRDLAAHGSHGAHRFPLTDLTVVVAAQVSGLDVLHHDRHFERLGTVLGVGAPWLAEPA